MYVEVIGEELLDYLRITVELKFTNGKAARGVNAQPHSHFSFSSSITR